MSQNRIIHFFEIISGNNLICRCNCCRYQYYICTSHTTKAAQTRLCDALLCNNSRALVHRCGGELGNYNGKKIVVHFRDVHVKFVFFTHSMSPTTDKHKLKIPLQKIRPLMIFFLFCFSLPFYSKKQQAICICVRICMYMYIYIYIWIKNPPFALWTRNDNNIAAVVFHSLLLSPNTKVYNAHTHTNIIYKKTDWVGTAYWIYYCVRRGPRDRCLYIVSICATRPINNNDNNTRWRRRRRWRRQVCVYAICLINYARKRSIIKLYTITVIIILYNILWCVFAKISKTHDIMWKRHRRN